MVVRQSLVSWLRDVAKRGPSGGLLPVVGALAGGLGLAAMAVLAAGGDGPARPPAPPAEDGPWTRLQLPPEDDAYELTASDEDAAGIALDAEFLLVSREPLTARSVEQSLRTEPALSFDVKVTAGTRASLRPKEPLRPGTLYRFTMFSPDGARPLRSWAFQATSPLSVVTTLPADQSTGVPRNTGIELTFSHDGFSGAEDRFSIDPPVPGRFERHKRVLVFVPERELEPQTLYTVTLRSGTSLPGTDATMAADRVVRFETAPREGASPVEALQFSRRTLESRTGEAPILPMFASTPLPFTASFTIFRFAGADQFIATLRESERIPAWAYYSRGSNSLDTSTLPEVVRFDAQPERMGEYGDLFVRAPEALPPGFYLVDARVGEARAQGWLQITDVATYTAVSESRMLVWANDVATGAPIPGATVEMPDGRSLGATTGADGVAMFDTPAGLVELKQSPFGYTTSDIVSDVVVRAPDGRSAVMPLGNVFSNYRAFGFREYSYYGDPGAYWRYLYTDRQVYLPDDTVRLWGIVRPRDGAGEKDLVATVSGSGYDGTGYDTRVSETRLRTTPAGTFITELPLADLSPGYYNASIKVDGEEQTVTSLYFEVRDYVKPAYRILVTPSKLAAVAGEEVTFGISAEFYDGSPVPQTALNYSGIATGTVVTDSAGRATVTATVRSDRDYSANNALTVAPVVAEEGEITANSWIRGFPSTVTFSEVQGTFQTDTGATVSGEVRNVDFDRLNAEGSERWEDAGGSAAAGVTVNASVKRIEYDRISAGSSYDFISKRPVERFEYREREASVAELSTTTGADGSFAMTFAGASGAYYQVTLRARDGGGREDTTGTSVQALTPYSRIDDGLYIEDMKTDRVTYPVYDYGNQSYATGERVELRLSRQDGEPEAGGNTRFLFFNGKQGIQRYTVNREPVHTFTFSDDDVPSTTVFGVMFNGSTFLEVRYPRMVSFNPQERKLDITIEPDAERYAPGSQAELRITTRNASGDLVPAEVNVSAVDEAAFQAGEPYYGETGGILQSLYTPVSSGVLRTYFSHFYPFAFNAAERGGDGGPRDNFKDVALFERVTTGEDGTATVTFDLPDNLTSWRVTANAVTDDLLAGSAQRLVPVGLPFFVEATLNRDYLVSDRASVRVRALGTDLPAGSDVTFTLAAPSLGISQPIEVGGKAFEPAYIELPPLAEGRHELTISAKSGEFSDALVRTIDVVASRLARREARYASLGDGSALEGSDVRSTTVVFSDQNRGGYLRDVQSLAWGWGDRADQALARVVALDLLRQEYGDELAGQYGDEEFRAASYQVAEGGIALFPYAGADLLLSARVASVGASSVGRPGLAGYFRRVVDDPAETRERVLIALWGLSSLGEPVLADVRAAAGLPDLAWRERLYVALAASALGDDATARRLYRGLLEEYGEERGAAVRIAPGVDADDTIEATAALASVGAQLGDVNGARLFEYTRQNATRDLLVGLEQLAYLQRALPRLPDQPVTVSYRLDGERRTQRLERGESLALRVTPRQLRELDPRAESGNVGVSTLFDAPFDAASANVDAAVGVTRQIEAADGGAIREGALVRVTLRWRIDGTAVDGCYQVTDVLPSGLRPVTQWASPGVPAALISFPYNVRGQRVSFCVGKGYQSTPITYLARVVSKGTFVAEPAIIQSQQAPETMNLSETQVVEIP